MDFYRVEGGRPLQGRIKISGAKNCVLKLMAASLMTEGRTVLLNVPRIADVFTMAEVLEHLGARIDFEADAMNIDTSGEITGEAPYELVRKMRASFNVLGPLLARLGHARVALPGGCNIGNRPVEQHERGLSQLGVSFTFDHGYLEAVAGEITGAKVILDIPSRGATENLMTAGALAKGTTIIDNAAREPDIVSLAEFLNTMGAKIRGAGTSTVTIEGADRLEPASYWVPADPIEAGTYALAALAGGGDAELLGARAEDLEMFLAKIEESGAEWTKTGEGLRFTSTGRAKAVDFVTLPFPGFPTDLQPQMMAYLATAEGTSIVTENMFESRFLHVAELLRMGADIRTEGHHAVVRGVPKLQGAPVRASDLRAGAALMIAAISAAGATTIYDIHHLERGYQDMAEKLTRAGALVEKISHEPAALAW
jgi:UDP-N-acetylglucosamine 1-carboxyvinyltransferase